MKYYNNVFRPIAPPVDMSILQNTYNTLEEGHLKGVELASKLRSEIAQLPLNESEQPYKDELASDIENTIIENSFNENAYYAIPDLVKKYGDIKSNPILNNKLQAQADYKAFQDSVENNEKLTEDMKEYYKELNPYKSGQQADGSYDTSFKWTPNTSPKMVVSLADMVTKGISRAAKEKGAGTVTRWLDSNGNITNDPNKAYDGEVYNATTNQWERLTREKILAGIQSVIAETPGAAESLKQDYDVAIWKLGKQATTDANGNPIVPVSDVTDPNGIPLTESEYLMKRIAPAIAAAEYYNNISQTTYGNGLATYKARQVRATADALANALKNDVLDASGRGMILQLSTNPAGDAVNDMNTAKNSIIKFYKDNTGKDVNPANFKDIERIVEEITPNLDAEKRSELTRILKTYKIAEENLNSFTKDMSEYDKKEWDWANRMANNGQLINGASKHDDKILNLIKDRFDSNGNFSLNVPKDVIDRFRDIINTPSDYGLSINNDNTITINKENINYIPQILSKLNQAYNEAPFNAFSNRIYAGDSKIIDRVAREYNKASNILDRYSKKYFVNPQNIDVDVTTLEGQTWSHNYLEKQYELGLIDGTTYEKMKTEKNESIGRFLATNDLTQYQIFKQDKDNKGHVVVSPQDRAKITAEINAAHKDKRIEYVPAFAPGAVDPLHNTLGGYFITIYHDDSGKKGTDKYYIPGFGGENARLLIMSNPEVIAANELAIMTQTNSFKYFSLNEDNPILGNVKVSPLSAIAGYEIYNVDIWGTTIPMNKKDSSKFAVAITEYQQIKDYYQAGGEQNERFKSALSKVCSDIAETTGEDVLVVAQKLGQDIEL